MTPQKRNIKKSDLSWLKQLPQNWDVLPNRAIFKERNTRNTIDERLLSVTIKNGVISQTSMMQQSSKKDSSNEDKSKYKLVFPGDIVYNKMRMWQGAVGYSNLRGIVSPAYIVLRSSRDIYPKYFHYLFRSPAYSKECHKYSHGICDDQMSLRFEDFKTITSILPPIEEQQAIVHFLDYKCAQINKFIQKKKRLIELLKEQKQVIINQAVTRGLDPNVRFKPSGVEWLGDIPEHWKALPIKRLFSLIKYGTSESAGDEGKYKILTMGHIQDGKIVAKNCGFLKDLEGDFLLRYNDLLFNRTNSKELVGKVGIFKEHTDDYSFASYLVMLRVNEKSLPDYVNYLLNSYSFINYVRRNSIPSLHQSNLNPTRYSRFTVPLPPIAEQKCILEFIEASCSNINLLLDMIQQQIDLVQEYRTRLISDVVTGQLDVRNIEITAIIEEERIEDILEEDQEEESLELIGAGDED